MWGECVFLLGLQQGQNRLEPALQASQATGWLRLLYSTWVCSLTMKSRLNLSIGKKRYSMYYTSKNKQRTLEE